MYDAVKRAEDVARIVCRGDRRKYHRFRPARFYGGIATADCVGCCLACLFCWSWRQVARPGKYGEFFAPEQVAGKLVSICRRKGLSRMRRHHLQFRMVSGAGHWIMIDKKWEFLDFLYEMDEQGIMVCRTGRCHLITRHLGILGT